MELKKDYQWLTNGIMLLFKNSTAMGKSTGSRIIRSLTSKKNNRMANVKR